MAAIEPAQSRGGPPVLRYAVTGRNRFEVLVGMSPGGDLGNYTVSTGSIAGGGGVFGGIRYTRYVRENLAVTFSIEGFSDGEGVTVGRNYVYTEGVSGSRMPMGIRWNPFKGEHRLQSIKPFLTAGVGPVCKFH